MDKKTFWAQKNPRPEYVCVSFSHSAFGSYNLLAGKYTDTTLGGVLYKATPMRITEPTQGADSLAVISISFPLAVVGREFKLAQKAVAASGSREPIAVKFRVFLDFDKTSPTEEADFYILEDGIAYNSTSVTIRAGDDNPMRRSIGSLYTVYNYPGLIAL